MERLFRAVFYAGILEIVEILINASGILDTACVLEMSATTVIKEVKKESSLPCLGILPKVLVTEMAWTP
jgi:hypothetical protein